MIDRTIAPLIKDAIEFDLRLKPYESFTLDNGIKVYTINAGAQDVMQVELVFYAGNWFEEKRSVASATNFLLKNGTSTKNAFQLNEHFEYFGAYCNRACYNETAVVNLSTLTRHLPDLLPVVRELVTDAVFPEEELNTYKQNSRQRLAVNLKKCDFVAGRLIDSYLYGMDHPYGTFSNMEDIEALNVQELKDFYNKHYIHGQCIIFASGKLPADLENQLNTHFGQLQLAKHPLAPIPTHAADQKKHRINNDPDGVQGAIRIARPFPNRKHPDFLKAMVLNNLFGGFFGSRLMGNIREDKGYTYSIFSYLQSHLHESAWMVSTEAGKDVCEATIEEVYNEMKLLRDEVVEEDELLLVRNYMMGTILGDLDGPFHIMNRWKNIILNNQDEKYFYDYIETIKTISAEELRELARKYLNPEDFYELVVI